ncbi:MAG: hypothetical protein DI538_04740 [Azospira oryzae]|jgi:hypothetical protein|nr:hypothetical protein [Cytophaga sp.]PZR40258.1 MAG: hypothetical protein DI538_04740 [Azospira oryzae]
MNWVTIYISGKEDFREDILKSLKDSDFPFMQGYSEANDLALFWIDEKASVRDFKKAIGSKLVFKYRLHFFASVEEFVESKNIKINSFTKEEQALIRKMKAWDKSRNNSLQVA